MDYYISTRNLLQIKPIIFNYCTIQRIFTATQTHVNEGWEGGERERQTHTHAINDYRSFLHVSDSKFIK